MDEAGADLLLVVGGLVGLGLIAALGVWSFVSTARRARADDARRATAGIAGTGRVTFVEDVSERDSAYRERILHLDLTLDDGRRMEARAYLHLMGDREPAVGDVVRTRSHPDRLGDLRLLEAPFGWG